MLAVAMRLPSRASSPHTSVLSSAEARLLPLGRLVGHPNDIKVTDQALLELFPEDESLRRWLEAAEERVSFKDSRLEFVGSVSASETRREDCSINWWPKAKSPPPSSLAAITLTAAPWLPQPETEEMLDGTDAVSDWPLLNFATNIASGLRGSRSTMVAAWASASANTPAR